MRHSPASCALLALCLLSTACWDPDDLDDRAAGTDLPLGDLSADDLKADGDWGSALECKAVPSLPKLTAPTIRISLDGLTLRLRDPATGFDKVFPIGVGKINDVAGELTFDESLSYWPVLAQGKHEFSITPASIQPCKIWWTDPDTGDELPVFAGLPFLGWMGNYGIHGPIDNYKIASGGNLRRGYVSHGCIRMEAADVLEVYARIKGLAKVPVIVQREPERLADGSRADVPQRWIGSECSSSAQCNFPGGSCRANAWGGRGFCTAACTSACADRAGMPGTFCIADPAAPGQGMCVNKMTSVNDECRPYDHMVPAWLGRASSPSVKATVCVPGSRGSIGDRCLSSADCDLGNDCRAGMCSRSCTKTCPDEPGRPGTFCVAAPELSTDASCVRQCSPALGGAECPANHTCVVRSRNQDPSTVRSVCIPD